jgi:hypothetical protein
MSHSTGFGNVYPEDSLFHADALGHLAKGRILLSDRAHLVLTFINNKLMDGKS